MATRHGSLVCRSPFTDALVDPAEDEIGNLQVVLVLHDHVAVAADAALRWTEHLRLAASRLEPIDEGLTALERELPRGPYPDACRCIAVITEHDQNGYRRQRLDLLVGVVRRTTTRFDEHESFRHRGIQQRRCQGKRP